MGFPLVAGKYPTKTRSRSVPDVAVLNSQPLTVLLIKYQRLPRVFFWNTSLPQAAFFSWASLRGVIEGVVERDKGEFEVKNIQEEREEMKKWQK